MTVKTLKDLFIHDLSDVYSAEKQLARALPKMARAAENAELSAAFENHLGETQGQIERIDRIVELCEIRLKRIRCSAMEGLVEEAQDAISEGDKGVVRDAALIGCAQKVEHYEIASYGTLATFARHLGFAEAAKLLEETLEEEKATDKKLSMLAESAINPNAEAVAA